MIDAGQQRDEGLPDTREVAQREIAVVELAFFEALTDDAFDQALDGLTRVVARG